MRLFFRLSTLNHNLLRINMIMISFTSILLFIRLSYTTTPLRVISHCVPIPFILIHRSILSQPYLYEPSTRQHNTAESYSIDLFLFHIDLLSSNRVFHELTIQRSFLLKVSLESNLILPILLSFPSLEFYHEILPILNNSSSKINMLMFPSISQIRFPFSFHFIYRNFNLDSLMKE